MTEKVKLVVVEYDDDGIDDYDDNFEVEINKRTDEEKALDIARDRIKSQLIRYPLSTFKIYKVTTLELERHGILK